MTVPTSRDAPIERASASRCTPPPRLANLLAPALLRVPSPPEASWEKAFDSETGRPIICPIVCCVSRFLG